MSSFGETLVEKALGLLPRGKTRAKQGLEIYRRRKEHIHILTGILSGIFLLNKCNSSFEGSCPS